MSSNNFSIFSLILLFRPHQWLKNIFVFSPAFFAGKILIYEVFAHSMLAAFCFSMVSSSVYVLNDWVDRESDAKHPEKQNRPIASGNVSGQTALISGIFLLGFSILISISFLPINVLVIIAFYVFLNVAYTLHLKTIAILDITCIACGFVLRLFAGSFSTGIELSSWIITLTFLLALFLALAKRRDDVIREQRGEERTRLSSADYNQLFLDHSMSVMGAVVIVAYLQYCHATNKSIQISISHLYLTGAFVVVGLLRYLQLTLVKERTGSPTKILITDRFTQLNLFLWVSFFAWFLY